MKLVIVVPDGMCDLRYPALNNLSPVEYAHTPGVDKIIQTGHVGMVRTMFKGLPLGSLVGLLGLLGYNPKEYFPMGRSIFEAHALGLELSAQDLAFRCNIVRVSPNNQLLDFTAGQISEEAANNYLAQVQLPPPFEIHHDLSYRNVLIYRNCTLPVTGFSLSEPHENMDTPIENILPHYNGQPFGPLVELMQDSRRGDLMLWPWGVSRTRTFPPIPYRAYMVTALSFLYGMMTMLGGEAVMPSGATGYLGSNLQAKFTALTGRLAEFDVAVIHCNAPDEESHIHNLQGKVQAIEDIDRQVVSPLLEYLESLNQPYRILFCPDHYTCCGDGKHRPDPVPYAVAGHGITSNQALTTFSEVAIARLAENEITESFRLIPALLE